jgi:hypothetical protein
VGVLGEDMGLEYGRRCLEALRRREDEGRLQAVQREIVEAERRGDTERRDELLMKKVELRRALERFH